MIWKAYLDHAYAQHLAKPPFMRICREFENRRDLHALSGKFLVHPGDGQDGPGDLVGDALVLEFPDVCAQGAFASKRKNRELVLNRTGSRGKWMRY